MFDQGSASGAAGAVAAPALTPAEVTSFVERLPSLQLDLPDAERIDLITGLEAVKGAVAAAQARVSVAFADSQVELQRSRGMAKKDLGRGVGAQVALARHESPSRGSRHLGLARALVGGELPHTMAHLTAGRTTEWRATIVCQETACLTVEQRREVDEALADELPSLGEARLRGRARALAVKLDNGAAAQRAAQAEAARRVTLRPAPTTMVYLTALLPVAQGVAAYAALRAAAAKRDPGDTRTVEQVCADVLVERVTGQSTAEAVPVEVHLVMPADGLFPAEDPHGSDAAGRPGTDSSPADQRTAADQPAPRDEPTAADQPGSADEPAVLAGQVLPASFARALLERCADAGASLWLRRLFTSPDGADLVALDSRRREFTGMLRRFVELRDQTCRTPWCDAPIRHIDHVTQSRHGGDTTAGNGRGTCAACNYAREAPGWSAEIPRDGPEIPRDGPEIPRDGPEIPRDGPEVPRDGPRWSRPGAEGGGPADDAAGLGPPHTVRLTTPTGHAYDSEAPPVLPGRVRRPFEAGSCLRLPPAAPSAPVEVDDRSDLGPLEASFVELLSA